MENINVRTRRLAVLGMMLAIIFVLSALEHMLPPIPGLPPNIRLGLSNIVTMYALFFISKSAALTLTVLKSVFTMMMRGPTAGFLSICGGLLSILSIILLAYLFRDKISYLILSVAGAIFHNVGQLLGASLLMQTNLLIYYLPILCIFGVLIGSVTGTLLRVVMPLFDRMLGSGGIMKGNEIDTTNGAKR